MNNRFNEKHAELLEVVDPEIKNFYSDWGRMQDSDEYETAVNLSAHLAREILEGLRVIALKEKKVPEQIERTWKDIILHLDKFRHRHKVWDPPYKKEEFNEVWSEFEILLVYIVESDLDFRNIADHYPFTTLQDSLMRLETKLDKLSTSEWPISNIELSDPQFEINQNLQTLAPLLAAFYRDWLRILQSTNFKCRSYLLGHLAREIDGGFRDILSIDQDKDVIEQVLEEEDWGRLYKSKGHIASIMSALGVPDFDLRSEQWIRTTKDLFILTHKNSGNKAQSLRNESEPFWFKFEELLAFLVGGYLNLLNRVDKILCTKQPSADIVGVLPNLLKLEVLYKHFFQNLKSPAWLERLKEDAWFNPENNPVPQENPEHPGYYSEPRWYALEYVEKVATQSQKSLCDETINILVNIVNAIIDYTDENEEKINNDYTNLLLIKIIGTLPIDEIKHQHITFMECALKSKSKFELLKEEIARIILPKLVRNGKKDLTLELLEVILDAKVVNGQIIAIMEYWLKIAFKSHEEALAKLCGVEAAKIALVVIRELIADGAYSFVGIQMIEDRPAYSPSEDYAELLVNFTSTMFRLTCPDSITTTVADLLQEGISESSNDYAQRQSHTIVGLIALKAIEHHYVNLKQLFWSWEGNPLDKTYLKPGLYQLIETNCQVFEEKEINLILDWIESSKYHNDREKIVALRKREWLTALLQTGNEKVISSHRQYEKINPAPIEHPGFNRWTEIWAGSASPLTVEELSTMSNAEIAEYLVNFKEPEIVIKKSDPTEEGLAKTLEKCVATNPQRFIANLHSFLDVPNFYLLRILHGFLEAWRDKKEFDWAMLLKFIRQILLSERFWTEQHNSDYNYRQWTLLAMADIITSGTVDDKRAFDAQLLPLAEQILLVLVEKIEPSPSTLDNFLNVVPNSNRGKVFSAMINYALRCAHLNNLEQGIRWPRTIRDDFTKRLDRSVEPSFEFSFTLGVCLSNLLYLDEEWVLENHQRIFPQQQESHWQAAFSGYLLYSQIYQDIYFLFKEHGHYQKALCTGFTNEVKNQLVEHICIGWIQDWETLDDDKSLIYRLINNGTPEFLPAVVHFFLEQSDILKESDDPEKIKAYEKVRIKVKPTWCALFKILSQRDGEETYQSVLGPLSGWLELIDTIDDKVIIWVKESIKYIDKPSGYAGTLSRFVKALCIHASKTPTQVGEIYLEIPQQIIRSLQAEEDNIKETIRMLYNERYKDIADDICNLFGKAGVYFLKDLYEEYLT